jgi:hypothetical protein
MPDLLAELAPAEPDEVPGERRRMLVDVHDREWLRLPAGQGALRA